MFFGKNKTSLKLIKQHPELLEGCEYHIIENSTNPKKIKIGSGITELFLRSPDGEEYLIEGNLSKIKQYFVPSKTYDNIDGKIFKVLRPVGNLLQNQLLKEVSACQYDEKIQLGHGISEQYFIQKNTDKVIKVYGNSNQIKNLFEEIIPIVPQIKKPIIPQTKVEIIEKVIIKETTPVIGEQGIKGDPGTKGDRGDRGERGERGEPGLQGIKGEKGDIGDIGPQGPKGEKGDIGPRGPQGQKGEKGDQGEIGPVGPMGPQGPRGIQGEKGDQGIPGQDGIQGPIGLQGPIGPQGIRGEKGEKGDRGSIGIQGIAGPRGEVGPEGPMGPSGRDGISPVVEAQYPLILEDGILSFDSEQVSKVLDKFKNDDIQKAINQMAQMATPGGGGAVDVALNGDKIIRSVNTMNFIGDNITITRRRKNVDISISGGSSTSGVSSIIPGTGITISPTGGTGDVTINATAVGTTYYYQSSLPTDSGITMGYRWMDSDTGIEYVYINDGNSSQWIQPTNTSTGSSTAVSILATTGVTGATYAALASDYYIGVSYAGPVTITLPSNPETGREIVVKDESGNAGNGVNRQITIVGATASQKIDNQNSAIINLDNAGLHFIYRNGWRII